MRRALIAIVLLLVPTLVLAQAETTGRVTGTVLDEDRNPVAGAAITLESPALQGQRTSSSDANGRYLASLLPPGVYTMTVNAPGKTPLQYTFRVGIGQTVPIDAVLKSGSDLVEDITVFAPAAKLETTAGGESFNYQSEINQLPILNRTLESVATLAPNVSFGPTAGTLTISGAPSFDTVVLLDGSEVSDPYFGSAPTIYLEEAIEEMQVLTNGVSAKYGRFQGGVVNATTKSGGNTFDGSLRADFAKESWNSKTPFGETQSDQLNKIYSATIGGPILKDRLWFFVGGRTIPTSETTGSLTSYPGDFVTDFVTTRDEDRWQAKLSGAITSNHVIEASYLKFDAESVNRAGLPAGDLFAATGKRSDPRDIIALDYQGVLTDRMFLNVQATQKQVSIQSGGPASQGSPFLEGVTFSPFFRVFHNHWWDYGDASVRDNDTASASMTNLLSSGSWGDHTLEYGIQYVNSITSGENVQSSTGFNLLNYDYADFADCTSGTDCTFQLISLADGGTTYRWKAIRFSGDQELENIAAFVQDSWEIGKWRVDAGLRYEDWQGSGPFPTLDLDFQEWSPRLGVTYNVTSDWQLQASWGKYIARLNDNIAGSITGVSGAPYVVSLYTGDSTPAGTRLSYDEVEAILQNDANWGVTTTITDPRQPTRALAAGVSAPYAYDTNFSVKRALPRNTGSVAFTYTNRQFKGLLDDYVGGQGIVTVVDPFGSGATNDIDFAYWDNCLECRRDYDAVTGTIDFRPSARWDLGGNYTYSRTRGNYEGEGRNTPASGSIIGNYPRSINADYAYPYGYTDDDVRHRVRGWGNYRFDFGRGGNLNLGGVFQYRSGTNFNRTGVLWTRADDEYLGLGPSYTGIFGGRGNGRFPGFWALDLSLTYRINFYRDLGMYVKLDVLNATNEDQLVQYSTAGGSFETNGTPQGFVGGPDDVNRDGVIDGTGILTWVPRSSFGNARNQFDYQTPRTYGVTVGLVF